MVGHATVAFIIILSSVHLGCSGDSDDYPGSANFRGDWQSTIDSIVTDSASSSTLKVTEVKQWQGMWNSVENHPLSMKLERYVASLTSAGSTVGRVATRCSHGPERHPVPPPGHVPDDAIRARQDLLPEFHSFWFYRNEDDSVHIVHVNNRIDGVIIDSAFHSTSGVIDSVATYLQTGFLDIPEHSTLYCSMIFSLWHRDRPTIVFIRGLVGCQRREDEVLLDRYTPGLVLLRSFFCQVDVDPSATGYWKSYW